tara:strand:+ start:397 stop:648 length:252 start_codon:yes stop_codon:yes gene_type:complete
MEVDGADALSASADLQFISRKLSKPEPSGQKQNIGAIRLDHTNSSGQVSTIAGAPVLGWRRKNRNENPSYPLKTGFGTPHPTP